MVNDDDGDDDRASGWFPQRTTPMIVLKVMLFKSRKLQNYFECFTVDKTSGTLQGFRCRWWRWQRHHHNKELTCSPFHFVPLWQTRFSVWFSISAKPCFLFVEEWHEDLFGRAFESHGLLRISGEYIKFVLSYLLRISNWSRFFSGEIFIIGNNQTQQTWVFTIGIMNYR